MRIPQDIAYGPPDATGDYQSIPAYLRPYDGHTLWGDMCGYGQITQASGAQNIGEYGGWVSVAKQALIDLGYDVANVFDVVDDEFTFNVNAFQEAAVGTLVETPGYLDPATTKILQESYKTVFDTTIELMPVYPTETGIAVGWPSPDVKREERGIGKALAAVGVLIAGIVGVNLIFGATK